MLEDTGELRSKPPGWRDTGRGVRRSSWKHVASRLCASFSDDSSICAVRSVVASLGDNFGGAARFVWRGPSRYGSDGRGCVRGTGGAGIGIVGGDGVNIGRRDVRLGSIMSTGGTGRKASAEKAGSGLRRRPGVRDLPRRVQLTFTTGPVPCGYQYGAAPENVLRASQHRANFAGKSVTYASAVMTDCAELFRIAYSLTRWVQTLRHGPKRCYAAPASDYLAFQILDRVGHSSTM